MTDFDLVTLDRAIDILDPLNMASPGTARFGQLVSMTCELIEAFPDAPDGILRLELQRLVD